MPPTPKDWRERFYEEIGKYIENRNIVLVYPDKLVIQIKDFITSLRQEERNEMEREFRKVSHKVGYSGERLRGNYLQDEYILLQDALTIIREEANN